MTPDTLLQLVWLAGLFGMRAGWSGRSRDERIELFRYLTDVWIELGCPPYPVTATWYHQAGLGLRAGGKAWS